MLVPTARAAAAGARGLQMWSELLSLGLLQSAGLSLRQQAVPSRACWPGLLCAAPNLCPPCLPRPRRARRPPEFESSSSAAANQAAEQLAAMGLAESDGEEEEAAAAAGAGAAARQGEAAGEGVQASAATAAGAAAADGAGGAAGDEGGSYCSSSEDDLPPIPRFQNRKVIEYEVSDSDDDSE